MGIWFCEMEVNCPKKWDELMATDSDIIRNCDECGKSVHFVDTPEKLESAAQEGNCVAFYRFDDELIPLGLRVKVRKTRLKSKEIDTHYMTLGLPRSVKEKSKLIDFINKGNLPIADKD